MARDWPLFEDDTSLAYGIALLRDVAQLFVEFEDVLTLCGIPENWVEVIFSPSVTGGGIVTSDDFYNRDDTTGRVWFRIRFANGKHIDVGRYGTG